MKIHPINEEQIESLRRPTPDKNEKVQRMIREASNSNTNHDQTDEFQQSGHLMLPPINQQRTDEGLLTELKDTLDQVEGKEEDEV